MLTVVIVAPATALSQGARNSCLDLVRTLYRKAMTPSDQSTPGMVSYTVRTVMRDSLRYPTSRASVDVVSSREKVHMVTKEVELYQDASISFTVLPGRKIVYVADSDWKRRQEMQGKSLASIPDSLFKMSEVTECGEVRIKGGVEKRITLRFLPKAQQFLKIATMTFIVDPANERLKKIVLNYTSASKAAYVEVTIDKVVYDYRSDAFSKPVRALFLDAREQLLPQYKGFKLVDTRAGNNRK